jgi:hypothetical protein
MKKALTVITLCFIHMLAIAQKKEFTPVVIGFYNLENFYDTVNNTMVNDEEFLPSGPRNYNSAIYWDKVNKLATVISQIGTEINPDGPAILGVAEVENDTVLNDLVHNKLIEKRGYRIVHYDSRDVRGIDVGLLYNPKYFHVLASDKLFVQLPGGSKDAYFTRDVLWVKGQLGDEVIHIYVNHWPSRVGGEVRSAPARAAAAMVCKHHMDSIAKADGYQKVVIMGDLNDDPTSPSVAEVLGAKEKPEQVHEGGLFNPWIELYKKGIGTLAYQNVWGLFDQIMISYPWLDKKQKGFFYYQQHIFNREYMVENKGSYKGYPMRTWDGNTYRGGYSDHFPTYLVLLREKDKVKKGF